MQLVKALLWKIFIYNFDVVHKCVIKYKNRKTAFYLKITFGINFD